MRIKLKRLQDQVVVITGASSGIGLTTAEMAARHGARVVLNARNAGDLQHAADRICQAAGCGGGAGCRDDQNDAEGGVTAIQRSASPDAWKGQTSCALSEFFWPPFQASRPREARARSTALAGRGRARRHRVEYARRSEAPLC
jgi:NAD(P)-dependent dehydrogenase (short-subunit alcohol dehydrogenase family)